jgi:hypothetical protein
VDAKNGSKGPFELGHSFHYNKKRKRNMRNLLMALRVQMAKKNPGSKMKTSEYLEKRHVLILLTLLLFLVGCSTAGADGGHNGAGVGNGSIQLPPAWTPTPISIPETGAEEGTWQPCDDAPPSRLEVGNRAVVEGITFNLRLRGEPGLEGTLKGEVAPAEVVEIINGPACVEQLVWWEVKAVNSGETGWAAEGNAYGNWLGKVE